GVRRGDRTRDLRRRRTGPRDRLIAIPCAPKVRSTARCELARTSDDGAVARHAIEREQSPRLAAPAAPRRGATEWRDRCCSAPIPLQGVVPWILSPHSG